MLREDDEVRSCRIYGKNGQGQFGIDIEAELHTGGLWLGQCKAHENFKWTDLRDAADKFWENRNRWKKNGAKSFIVIVGSGIEETKVWDNARIQKEKFKSEDIDFQLWDAREIRARLRAHRSIVERTCDVWWVENICGTDAGEVVLGAGKAGKETSRLALPLAEEIAELKNKRLSEIREMIRTGKELSAEEELSEMRRASSWTDLSPDIRGRVFRMQIGLTLRRRNNIEEAQRLLNEAKEEGLDGSLKIPKALISYYTGSMDSALRIIEKPSNVDEWNLFLALTINSGRTADLMKEFEAPRYQPDAETLRLKAIVYLTQGRIESARLSIADALKINPAWRRLKEVEAVVDYYSALSPAADGFGNLEWPVPVDWQFVRRDDESTSAIRRAADCFATLVSATEITETERYGLKVWHLASLSNDPSRKTEAEGLAQEILKANPGNTRIAIWACKRGYEFNRLEVRRALEKLCEGEPRSIEPVQALFLLIADENDFVAAGRLLDRHRGLYEQAGALAIWRFERSQAFAVENQGTKARKLLDEETDANERHKLEVAILRVEAAQGGSFKKVAEVSEQRFRQTNSDADLFAACESHLYAQIPSFIADNARDLVSRVRTESALQLALEGCFEAGKYGLCLELNEEYVGLFPGRKPPPIVRRLKVASLQRIGRLVEAQQEAELLAQSSFGTMDQFTVFEAQRASGDMIAATKTGRRLLSDPDVSARGLLYLSNHLKVDAPDVAREAFEKVLERGITNATDAMVATEVGFNLGFDDQIAPFIEQVAKASDQPEVPVDVISISDIREMIEEHRKAVEQDSALYGRGEIPVHIFSEILNSPIVQLYHGLLKVNEARQAPLRSFATMVRSGSKDKPRSMSSKSASLFLDVTSFLLAEHLDLLDLIENEFKPIIVSPELPALIQEQIEFLSREQVHREAAKVEVLRLVAEERITLTALDENQKGQESGFVAQMGWRWIALLEQAQRNNGYLVDFLPLRSNDGKMDSVQLKPEIEKHLRSAGDIAQALEQCGILRAGQFDRAIQRLGNTSGSLALETRLDPDSFVILERSIAENLAFAGILEPLANHCRVLIQEEEHLQLREEERHRLRKQELASWVRRLRDRLRRSLHAGVYSTKGNDREIPSDSDLPTSLIGRCAFDLLDQTRSKDTWTCCDDRFIGRFERVGESRIVDLFDVLHELRRRGILSTEELFSRISVLRAGNTRYVPISKEEILFELDRTVIGQKGLIETPELAILRRYAAAVVLDKERLQRPPINHPKWKTLNDIGCVTGFYVAGIEALMTIWGDESLSRELIIARSDWLLSNFLIDIAGAMEVWNADSKPSAVQEVQGAFDGHLFFRAITFSEKKHRMSGAKEGRQKEYINWLTSRLQPDGKRLKEIGKHLGESFSEVIDDDRSGEDKLVSMKLLGRVYTILPQEVQKAVQLRKKDLNAMGIHQWKPIRIGEYNFDFHRFFKAAEKALRTGKAALAAEIPKRKKFYLKLDSSHGSLAVILKPEDETHSMRVSDAPIGLLHDDHRRRETCLYEERQLLDISKEEAKLCFPRLARIKNSQRRIGRYYELLESSLAFQVGALTRRLARNDEIDGNDLLPPSTEEVLKHLRLPRSVTSEKLHQDLDKAAETLLADEGFEEAFLRVALLPIKLPSVVSKAFHDLLPKVREEWVRKALSEATTPILRLQVSGMLLEGNAREIESGVDVICSFADDIGKEGIEAFEAVFSWTSKELKKTNATKLSETGHLLSSWTYAGRLHQLLSAQCDQAEIIRYFSENSNPPPSELFRRNDAIQIDVAGPQLFRGETIAILGVAAVLENRNIPQVFHQRIGDSLRRVCFPFEDNRSIPALSLLRIRETQRDALGSFFAECRSKTIEHYIGSSAANAFSAKSIRENLARFIRWLSKEPNDKDLWTSIIAYVGNVPIPSDLRDRFRSCLLATDWIVIWEIADSVQRKLLLFLCGQTSHFSDRKIKSHCRSELIRLARHCAANVRGRAAVEQASILLVECSHSLALSSGNDAAAATQFASIMREICGSWPEAARPIWSEISPVILRQPSVCRPKLWPLIFNLRAFGERLDS